MSLISNRDVTAVYIHKLCEFYGFDPLVLARVFSVSYRQVNKLISLDDLSSSFKSSSTPTSSSLTLTAEGNTMNDELLDFV